MIFLDTKKCYLHNALRPTCFSYLDLYCVYLTFKEEGLANPPLYAVYVALSLMAQSFLPQILKILNSNSETPYLIWDNMTREELKAYVGEQQRTIIGTVSLSNTAQRDSESTQCILRSTHSPTLLLKTKTPND